VTTLGHGQTCTVMPVSQFLELQTQPDAGDVDAAAGGGMALQPSLPGLSPPLPCFHPVPESQPVLPCLLRRLLQKGALAEAHALARRHESGPHFHRSLEWLLFTALEMESSKPLVGG
jgi:hypothetical protein